MQLKASAQTFTKWTVHVKFCNTSRSWNTLFTVEAASKYCQVDFSMSQDLTQFLIVLQVIKYNQISGCCFTELVLNAAKAVFEIKCKLAVFTCKRKQRSQFLIISTSRFWLMSQLQWQANSNKDVLMLQPIHIFIFYFSRSVLNERIHFPCTNAYHLINRKQLCRNCTTEAKNPYNWLFSQDADSFC